MPQDPESTVIVRDRDGVRQAANVNEWDALTMQAALSADPRTFGEFANAWLRYRPDEPLEEMSWTDWSGEFPPGPWLLFDLACLRVLAGGGAELAESPAAFQRDDGDWAPGNPVVWINFPPGWECAAAGETGDVLPPLPVVVEPLDARGVLFGRALAAGIAERTLEIARREGLPEELPAAEEADFDAAMSESEREAVEQWHALSVRVHADWLLAPRDDLEGRTPRHYLHAGRNWVDLELSNRQLQWSQERRAPRGLDRDTFAYRHGPLGRHEMVMYFDLCREVIAVAWERIIESPDIDEQALAAELHQHAAWWLAEGDIDGDPTPPAAIIENERRRMPLVGDGSHLDCDCPICRMQADGALGPMFRGFDGYHLELDDEFAFSFCETRDEWERKQEEQRRWSEEFDAQRKEREAAGEEPPASAWSASYVDEELLDQVGASSPLSMMALAVRLAELVTDLKAGGGASELIDSLNEGFDAYRAAQDDAALAEAAQAQLIDVLEQITAAQPRLTAKAADMQSLLDEHRRRSDFPF